MVEGNNLSRNSQISKTNTHTKISVNLGVMEAHLILFYLIWEKYPRMSLKKHKKLFTCFVYLRKTLTGSEIKIVTIRIRSIRDFIKDSSN